MARTGITYEEVELQAETFVAKGENPTLEKVRRALGDRGSNSTLSKYINEWRGRRGKTTATLSSGINLSDPVNEAVNRVWQQLKEDAESEIIKAKGDAKEFVDAANKLKDQLEAERNQAFNELENVRGNLIEARANNSNLVTTVNQIQKELEVTLGRFEEFIQRHEEFKLEKEKQLLELANTKDQSIQYLKKQIDYINCKHQKEIDDQRTLMENQRGRWYAKEDGLRIDNANKENNLKKMEGLEQQSKQSITELKEQVKKQDLELQNVRNDVKTLTEKLVISEKNLSATESSLMEIRHWAEIHKQERDCLEEALRRERRMIGRLEERIMQIEQQARDRINTVLL